MHATHMLLSTHNECLVVFELNKTLPSSPDAEISIDGKVPEIGDAMIKLIAPINEKLTVRALQQLHLGHRRVD